MQPFSKVRALASLASVVVTRASLSSALDAAFKSLPLQEPVGQYLDFEYALVDAPLVNAAGLTFDSLASQTQQRGRLDS